MRKFILLLPFGLLGGLVTFLGGLVGNVDIGVLWIRSLLAVIICIVVLFVFLLFVSKTLFQGIDLFSRVESTSDSSADFWWGKRFGKGRTAKQPNSQTPNKDSTPKKNWLANDANNTKNSGMNNFSISTDIPNTTAPQAQQGGNDAIEERLRSADSKELANLVRHSMNEEL